MSRDWDRHREYNRQWKKRKKGLLLEYKRGKPCADCGNIFPPVVMEFDHLSDKLADVSSLRLYSMGRILSEIEKCELVCSNCHQIRTYLRSGGEPKYAELGVDEAND